MKRRTFAKAMLGGLACANKLSAGSRTPQPLHKGGALKKIVVLFQRGGNDGLNTLIPVDGPEHALYQNLRPSLHIPSASALSISGESFFALHPALAPLNPIIAAGDLSMIHAVGYPNSDRSHFESQSYLETAIPGNSLTDGWLNRFLTNTAGPGIIRGISIGYNIPQSVSGDLAVPVSSNFGLSSVNVDPALVQADADSYEQKLRDLFALTPGAGNTGVYNTGNQIFQMVDAFSSRNLESYTPENNAVYPDGYLGEHVSHAAQMLKDDNFLGVEVVTIDHHGYDNHANQISSATNALTGDHNNLLTELGQAMAAFYTDMGPARMADTLFLVVSEFGRRAYENHSLGTDHGTGSLAMVMGGGADGSILNGGASWPGLGNLLEGDDLMWVTDYRDIYWEILSRHMGVNNTALANIIPGHTFSAVDVIS